jgi:hypothetical protein
LDPHLESVEPLSQPGPTLGSDRLRPDSRVRCQMPKAVSASGSNRLKGCKTLEIEVLFRSIACAMEFMGTKIMEVGIRGS